MKSRRLADEAEIGDEFPRIAFLCSLSSRLIQSTAQSDAALSGAITDTSGNPIDHAAITAKAATGVVISTASSSDGTYKLSHLDPGDYTVIAKAKGFTAKSATITLAAGDTQTLDFSLTSVSSQQQAPSSPPAATPATELPNAPSSTPASPNAPTAPSLSDLGFTPQQTQSNPQLQAYSKREPRCSRSISASA